MSSTTVKTCVPTPARYCTIKQKLDTQDNPHRAVLLWSIEIEDILSEWHSKCLRKAEQHDSHGNWYNRLHLSLVIPGSLIPLTLATFSSVLPRTNILFIVGMLLTGLLSTSIGVVNPGGRSRQHRSFNAQYNELSTDITAEMVKPQRHRLEADVFLQRVMDKFNFLNNLAPPLPPTKTT